VYAQGVLIAQCGELVAVNNSSCNLSSLNLVKYFDGVQGINWELFAYDINIMITAMDIICGSADYPTKEIKEMTIDTRPLGLGFTNLGALLMMRGFPYASEEARDFAGLITRFMTHTAYKKSASLAEKLGSYPAFKDNKELNIDIAERLCGDSLLSDQIRNSGLRNSQLTLLAPTGTISLLMDCDSFGIEPLFALKSFKRLSGGGSLEFEPNCVKFAKEKFGDSVTNLYQTANELSWKDHIDMLATCQRHLSGGISKTINMRNDSTIEDIKEAYMYAWKSGCKGITVYRDGSKNLQPLVDATKKTEEKIVEPSIAKEDSWAAIRRKLPETSISIRHKLDIAGFEGYIHCGMYEDGSLGEIFIRAEKMGSTMQGFLDAFATSISIGLQYGVPLEMLIRKFSGIKFEPAGFTSNQDIPFAHSVIDYIFRWLEKEFIDKEEDEELDEEEEEFKEKKKISYIPENKKISFDGPPCPNCNSITGKVGTCYLCSNCGTTTGCS
jgi:ribonucleoside-diphosphate reductase alpha chain